VRRDGPRDERSEARDGERERNMGDTERWVRFHGR
jgi:hypothetical protein